MSKKSGYNLKPLENARLLQRVSFRALGDHVGYSKQMMHFVFRGDKNTRPEVMREIAAFLKVPWNRVRRSA